MRNTSQQLVEDRIKELRENTDFVSTLLESLVGYAIIAADFDGNIIAYNEGARQIYGYAPEEIVGKKAMVRQYGDLLELALEHQAYRVEHDISGKLRTIVEQLHFFKAGARDVVEIHSSAMRSKTDAVNHIEAQGYVEEGRVMVLELMGHLASYYRTYSLGATTMKMNDRPIKEGNDE